MNINTVTLVGRLAGNPKFFEGETEKKDRLLFTVIVNRRGSESSDAIPIICWDKLARAGTKYLKKGKEVAIEGSIITYYNKETGENHVQVRAHSVEYGADSKKQTTNTNTSEDRVMSLLERLAERLGPSPSSNSCNQKQQNEPPQEEEFDAPF